MVLKLTFVIQSSVVFEKVDEQYETAGGVLLPVTDTLSTAQYQSQFAL
jgi:hypothetical protein